MRRWILALVAAILAGEVVGQACDHALARVAGASLDATRFGPAVYYAVDAFVLTLIARPRRGWLAGGIYAAIVFLAAIAFAAWAGVPVYRSWSATFHQMRKLLEPADALDPCADVLAAALGGHLGVLLRNKLATKRRQPIVLSEVRREVTGAARDETGLPLR